MASAGALPTVRLPGRTATLHAPLAGSPVSLMKPKISSSRTLPIRSRSLKFGSVPVTPRRKACGNGRLPVRTRRASRPGRQTNRAALEAAETKTAPLCGTNSMEVYSPCLLFYAAMTPLHRLGRQELLRCQHALCMSNVDPNIGAHDQANRRYGAAH